MVHKKFYHLRNIKLKYLPNIYPPQAKNAVYMTSLIHSTLHSYELQSKQHSHIQGRHKLTYKVQ